MKAQREIKLTAEELKYAELLRRWRFAPADDAIFTTSDYWKALSALRVKLGVDVHLRIDKLVGWPK